MPFSKYLPEHMGAIKLVSAGPFIAGSFAELMRWQGVFAALYHRQFKRQEEPQRAAS